MTPTEPTRESPNSVSVSSLNTGDNAAASTTRQILSPRRPRRLGKIVAFVLLLGVGGAAVSYWVFYEAEPKDDLGRFQGEWKLTTSEREEDPEGLPQVAVRITGDCWQYLAAGSVGKTYRITLDETTNPKQIELTLLDADGNPLGGYRSHGIYSIDRKTARVLVEPVNKPRPTNLDQPDALVWTLTKVKLQTSTEHRK